MAKHALNSTIIGKLGQPIAIGLLVCLLCIQVARLLWTSLEPLAPLGGWSETQVGSRSLATFDLNTLEAFGDAESDGQGSNVTVLPLKLFGVSMNAATGADSAIIATAAGDQSSYMVGDAILPGVMLKRVDFDHITLENGGAEETLFLDQSGTPLAAAPATHRSTTIAAATFTTDISFKPRTAGGKVSGFIVQPKGEGGAFNAAGLKPGDVIVSLNGVPARSLEDAVSVISQLPDKGNLTLQVERGGQIVPLNARISK